MHFLLNLALSPSEKFQAVYERYFQNCSKFQFINFKKHCFSLRMKCAPSNCLALPDFLMVAQLYVFFENAIFV